MAQEPQSLSQIYKKFTDTFSATENPRDVVRFAKRRLSVDLKYGDVKKFLTAKKKWDERVCEPLDSDFGQDWYCETVQTTSSYQKWLIDCYFKQKHHTTCSLVSLGIVLNAKLLSNYYLSQHDDSDTDDDHVGDEENKIEFEFDSDNEEDLTTLKSHLPFLTESKLIDIFPNYSSQLTIDRVLVSGMSLDEMAQVLLDFGCKSVDIQHCADDDAGGCDIFRQRCRSILSTHNMDIDGAILCNFDLWDLETGIEGAGGTYGHISPIAAYHEESDRVLLLDTFTDESWVKITALYAAMNTKIKAGGKSDPYRGYVVVHSPPVWRGDVGTNTNANEIDYEGNDTKPRNHMIQNEKVSVKQPRRRNHSSIDFDFIVFDDKRVLNGRTQQNYKRKSSRRRSKKLELYVEFDSEPGQLLWKQTQSTQYHQKWCVVEYFQQNKGSTSALVTFAIILNAKIMAQQHNDNEYDYKNMEDNDDKFNEEKIMELYVKCYNEKESGHLPKITDVINNGVSLEESGEILKLFGCKSVSLMYTSEMELNIFRDLIKKTLKKDSALLVNYDLLSLGTGIVNGCLSVIAAFNIEKDMILLMNTNWIIGKCWVKTQLLYHAMNTIDDKTGKYRGCMVVDGLPLFN